MLSPLREPAGRAATMERRLITTTSKSMKRWCCETLAARPTASTPLRACSEEGPSRDVGGDTGRATTASRMAWAAPGQEGRLGRPRTLTHPLRVCACLCRHVPKGNLSAGTPILGATAMACRPVERHADGIAREVMSSDWTRYEHLESSAAARHQEVGMSGRGRANAGWLLGGALAVVSVGLVVVSVRWEAAFGRARADLGADADSVVEAQMGRAIWWGLVLVGFPVVGVFLLKHHRGNVIGWLFCGFYACIAVVLAAQAAGSWRVGTAEFERVAREAGSTFDGSPVPPWATALLVERESSASLLATISLFAVVLLFPTGRLPSRRGCGFLPLPGSPCCSPLPPRLLGRTSARSCCGSQRRGWPRRSWERARPSSGGIAVRTDGTSSDPMRALRGDGRPFRGRPGRHSRTE